MSFNLLNHSGTQQDLYYDSHYRWRETLVDLSSWLGGEGSSPHTIGSVHCDSPRNILQTGMVLVLVSCYILEMLADYQIIKLLMKFKTYNNTGMNTAKFELSQIAGGRVNWHSPFRMHLGDTYQRS